MGVHRARRICSTSTAPGRSGIFCALALLGACATPAPRVVSPTAPAKETTPSSRPAPVAPPCADAVKLPAWSPKLEPRLLPRPRRGRTTALLCPLDNPGDCDARCTRGSAVDCYLLGLARYHGKGGPADLPAALAGFQKACALGMERACMNQAVMLDRGQGTPKKPLQAAAIYGRLCLKNVDASCSTLNRLRKRAPRASPVFWRTYREIKRREKQGIPSARWLGSDLMYFSKREDQDAGTSPDWLTITGSELEWAMHDNVVWCSRGHVNHCHHLAHDLIQGKIGRAHV